jgi:hypothetical protein
MKRIVMSLAVTVDEVEAGDRAADIASRMLRGWTGSAGTAVHGLTLLSARWEKDDPISTIR